MCHYGVSPALVGNLHPSVVGVDHHTELGCCIHYMVVFVMGKH